MSDYRGVKKTEIVSSLRKAEGFIRSLDLGPNIEQEINIWKSKDPYFQIESATNQKLLTVAMDKSGSKTLFTRMHDLFNHHAALDTAGVGLKVYRNLNRWGGFSGVVSADYRLTDEETDIHLVTQYVRMLAKQEDPVIITDEVIKQFKHLDYENDPGSSKRLSNVEKRIRGYIALAQEGREDEIKGRFVQNSELLRHVIKMTLFYATGMDEKVKRVPDDSPFGQYGVVVGGKDNDYDGWRDGIDLVFENVSKVLQPYCDVDEVKYAAIGVIFPDGPSGIPFVATYRAAQAVVREFPEFKVIDRDGHEIQAEPGNEPSPSGLAP